MFKFVKTEDETNMYDHRDVVIQSKHNDLNISQLCDIFKSFLLGCGFVINSDESVMIVPDVDTIIEETAMGLTDDQINDLFSLAKENNKSNSEFITDILVDYIEMSKTESEFAAVVEKLKTTDVKSQETGNHDEDAEAELDRVIGELESQSNESIDKPEEICAEQNARSNDVEVSKLVDGEALEKFKQKQPIKDMSTP